MHNKLSFIYFFDLKQTKKKIGIKLFFYGCAHSQMWMYYIKVSYCKTGYLDWDPVYQYELPSDLCRPILSECNIINISFITFLKLWPDVWSVFKYGYNQERVIMVCAQYIEKWKNLHIRQRNLGSYVLQSNLQRL